MIKLLIFFCINVGVFGSLIPGDDSSEIDRMPTPQMIEYFGYPVEIHNVTTEDGYILELHRIPHGRENNAGKSKAVIYLQHPLFSSSAEFIYETPEKGLGFILADNGFDVWMPNSRGNNYSRRHTTLDPDKDPEFWNFSWHEMGVYDIPAAADYIKTETGASDLLYIGHSQGTTQGLVAGSRIPDLDKKIRALFLLAPIAYLSHSESLLFKIGSLSEPLGNVASKAVRFQEFYPNNSPESVAVQAFCSLVPAAGQEICSNVLFMAFGYDSEQFNRTLLPRIFGHTPNGCSTKQLLHYAQLANIPRFNEYDDGPDYDLGKITIPTYLYSGPNDWLAALPDLDRLKSELGNLIYDYRVPFDKFNHGDFLFANDVIPLVYDRLLEDLNRVAAEGTEEKASEGES